MTLEILTGLLVVITGFYAWVTYKILRANEKIVEVARQEAENISRPYINITTFTVPESTIIYLAIENIGKTQAKDLKLSIDKDFYQFGDSNNGVNLKALNAFNNKIVSFSPNSKLQFYLAIGPQLFGEEADINVTPLVFNITAEHRFNNKIIKETTGVDLNIHLNSALVSDALVNELKLTRQEISKLPQALAKRLKP